MVHFYPKSHVTVSLLVLLMSAKKTGSWLFVSVCLSREMKMQEWQTRAKAGRAVNHHRSNGADKHSDRIVARPPKPHVSGQECIAHCIVGLRLGERVQTPWLTGHCEVGGCEGVRRWGQHNFRESECKVRRSVWIMARHAVYNCSLLTSQKHFHSQFYFQMYKRLTRFVVSAEHPI